MRRLTSLEEAVLRKLTDGEHSLLRQLREQVGVAEAVLRQTTEGGFHTVLYVPPDAGIIDTRSAVFGDVHADIPGLAYGAGFLLYVDHGWLGMLEGFTYDEAWPASITAFQVHYQNRRPRDWACLLAHLGPSVKLGTAHQEPWRIAGR